MKHICKILDTRFYSRSRKMKNKHSFRINVIIEQLIYIMDNYGMVGAASISIQDIVEFMQRDVNFREIIEFRFRESNLSIDVPRVEKILSTGASRLENIIREDGKSELYPYIASGEGVKKMQLCQLLFAIGTRAYATGRIIPMLVSNAYINILGSNKNINDILSEGISARTALGIKHVMVAKSGALSRNMNLLCLDTDVVDVKDCKSKNLVEIDICGNDMLLLLDGKHYRRVGDKPNAPLRTINGKKDKNLVGTRILMRSAVTCCLPEGSICQTCYGRNHVYLKDSASLGYSPSIEAINPLSNLSMSYKHNMTTNSMTIDNEEFNSLFTYSDGEYRPCQEMLNRFSIILEPDSPIFIMLRRHIDQNNDDDASYGTALRRGRGQKTFKMFINGTDAEEEESDGVINSLKILYNNYSMVDAKYPNEEKDMELEIKEILLRDSAMVPTDEFLQYISNLPVESFGEDDQCYKIPISKNIPIFTPMLYSDGSSKFIHQISSIVERSTSLDISEYLTKLSNTILSSRISCNITVMETIVYNLVRQSNNVYRRPNFSRKNPSYRILALKQAIDCHRSIMPPLLALGSRNPIFSNPETFIYCDKYNRMEELLAPSEFENTDKAIPHASNDNFDDYHDDSLIF